MTKKRIALFSAAGIGGVLLVLFIAYICYFGLGHRALPGTKVGEISVGGKTAAQISAQLQKNTENKHINFTGSDINPQRVYLSETGFQIDPKAVGKEVISLNKKWGNFFTAPFVGKKITPQLEENPEMQAALISKMVQDKPEAKPVVEPQIVVQDGELVVSDGQPGHTVAATEIRAAAQQLVNTQREVTKQLAFQEVQPSQNKEKLESVLAEGVKLINPEVAITIGDTERRAEQSEKVLWLDFSQEKAQLNKTEITKWLTEISQPLVREEVKGLRYINENGLVVSVRHEPQDAIEVTNLSEITESINENLLTGKPTKASFQTKTTPSSWEEKLIAPGAENLVYAAAPGEKWIDVNLSTYQMTAYEGATVVRGPVTVVTGTSETPTVVGTFSVIRKVPLDTMRGENPDGTKYVTPNVPHALYFEKHGYAIHGAPWWASWGFGGSHGCVNTPLGEARWFYNWAPVGTVVVTHY